MSDKYVPANYSELSLQEAQEFDKKVRKNFMPAIVSTVKQVTEDYGPLNGIGIDVGSATSILSIELCKHSSLKVYALEKENAIHEVARINVEKENLTDRVIPVLGDAHNMPFKDNLADFIISRGSYHCWKDKVKVFKEIYRVLKSGGIAIVGGGFGRYVNEKELNRMRTLRDKSLKEGAKAYSSTNDLKRFIEMAGISNFRIIKDPAGLWAEIRK